MHTDTTPPTAPAPDRPLRDRLRAAPLRTAEAVSLVALLVTFAATITVLEAHIGVEGHRLTGWLFDAVGYHVTATLYFGAYAVGFATFRRLHTRGVPYVPVCAAIVATASVANAVNDLWVLVSFSGEYALFSPVRGQVVAGLALATALWLARDRLRAIEPPRPTAGRARAAVLALVMLSSVAAMPLAAGFGSGSAQAASTNDAGQFNSALSVQDTTDNETVYIGENAQLRALDAGNGEEIWNYSGHSDWVQDTAPAPDGSEIYTASADGTVRAVDTSDGSEIWTSTFHGSDGVNAVVPHPEDNIVYSAGWNYLVAHDTETGDEIWNTSITDSKEVEISGDGSTLYLANNDGEVVARDTVSGAEIWRTTLDQGGYATRGLDLSPDGDYVYAGGADQTITALHTDDGSEYWNTSPHSAQIQTIKVSNDGDTVYSGGEDNQIIASDAHTGDQQWSESPHSDYVWDLSLSGDSSKLYSGSWDNTAKALDPDTGSEIWSSSASGSSVRSIESGATYSTQSNAQISGQVTTCPASNPTCNTPTGAPNDTVVEIYGVRESNLNPSQGQTLQERAEELRSEMESIDYESFGYEPDLDPINQLENTNNNYVAFHHEDDWALNGGSPTLDDPLHTLPADQDVIMSVWDPGCGNLIQDGLDEDLPGCEDGGEVVIEQLSYDGEVTDRRTIETDNTRVSRRISGASDHDYARVNLPAGFYRVSPKDSPYSIVVSVGDPDAQIRAITSDLETQADQLTKRGERIVELATQEKVVRKTVSTYEENGTRGQFNATVPSDVSEVQIQAYTPAAENVTIDDVQNASFEDLQKYANLETYNGSFYITPAPARVGVPANDTEIRAIEVTSPPFQGINRSINKSAWLQDLLQNETYSDTFSDFLEPVDNLSQEEIETIHEDLADIADENADLRDRLEDREDIDITLDTNQSTEQLREEIIALREGITQLEGSLEIGDPETDVGDGTIDATIPFDGDLDPDAITVVANDVSAGTTTPVPDEYWSVNKRTGRSDQLVIEDYPVNDSTAQIAFGITAVSEDGESIADAKVPVTNPAFGGQLLDLRSIDASSVLPGPSEQVTLEPTTAPDSVGLTEVNATVVGPNGERPVTDLGTNRIRFETDGAGSYQVTLELTDANGQSWSETVALQAQDETVARDPSLRAVDGFTGTYALAGDGLEGGHVETDGATLEVGAIAPSDNVPNTVHVYAEGVSNNYEDITVNLLKETGTNEPEAARRNAKVFIHVTELPDGAVAFREQNQPLGIGEQTAYGGAMPSDRGDAHVIQTHTEADGTVTVEVHKDPGVLTSAFYEAQKLTPFALPRPGSLNPLAILATIVTVFADAAADVATSTAVAVEPAAPATFDAPVDAMAATHGGATPA